MSPSIPTQAAPDPVLEGVGTVNLAVTAVYPVPTRTAPDQLEEYDTMVSLVRWSAGASIFLLGAEWRRAARLRAIFSERVRPEGAAMALPARSRPAAAAVKRILAVGW